MVLLAFVAQLLLAEATHQAAYGDFHTALTLGHCSLVEYDLSQVEEGLYVVSGIVLLLNQFPLFSILYVQVLFHMACLVLFFLVLLCDHLVDQVAIDQVDPYHDPGQAVSYVLIFFLFWWLCVIRWIW